MKRAGPWLALAVVLAGAAWQLRLQGRSWICSCDVVRLWAGDTFGPENSQQLFDPYSATHALHGFFLFGVVVLIVPRLPLAWQLVLTVSLEAIWEILENTATVIDRYRAETLSLGYTGDSILNSFGDILSCAVGALIARQLGLKRALVVGAVVEAVLLLWIRDSLILNVIMLVYPIPSIKAWQQQGY
jgi:hypothetical protein